MSTSYKLVCSKYHRDPSLGKIKLQKIKNRKATYKTLATIQYKNWSEKKGMVLSGEPDADEINLKIKEALLDAQIVKSKVEDDIEKVIKYAKNRISSFQSFNTKRSKQAGLNKLIDFKRDNKRFKTITPEFVRELFIYLEKDYAISTSYEYFTIIKYFINEAIDEKVIDKLEDDPFKKTIKYINKRLKPEKLEIINEEELKYFLNYEFEEPNRHLTQHSFKFMMFAAGMRISDFLHLTWNNFMIINYNMNVRFKMKKTKIIKETKLNLPALEALIPFIEDYKEIDLRLYQNRKKAYQKHSNELEGMREEHDKLETNNFSVNILEDKSQEAFNKLTEEFERNEKNKVEKMKLSAKINAIEKMIPTLKNEAYNALSQEIMKIKSNYSNDRIYPVLRGLSAKDLIKETRKRATKNNYFLKAIKKELDIKSPLSNHQARHVFAQRCFEGGANFHDVSIELGHKSLAVTENYRKQVSTEKSKDVVNLFAETF